MVEVEGGVGGVGGTGGAGGAGGGGAAIHSIVSCMKKINRRFDLLPLRVGERPLDGEAGGVCAGEDSSATEVWRSGDGCGVLPVMQ